MTIIEIRPRTLFGRVRNPTAVLPLPVVLLKSAELPIALLDAPVVKLNRAESPSAVLSLGQPPSGAGSTARTVGESARQASRQPSCILRAAPALADLFPENDDMILLNPKHRPRRYHDAHPFHRRMHEGQLGKVELQTWVLNRYYYQTRIPIKDALILAKSDSPDFCRSWIHRIEDHDGRRLGRVA